MEVLETLSALRRHRRSITGHLGLVPTMGALHDGHRALLRAARSGCDAVAASLFVNPTQFGVPGDFQQYPRTRERDLEIFAADGVDFVWAPPVQVMYPDGLEATLDAGPLAAVLEGASRPGHFHGVATVVARLFDQVRPHTAYFGQKDWQQTRVIHALVHRLSLDIQLHIVPTVRAADGLALSSRNRRLDPAGRAAAPVLHRALVAARAAFTAGETDSAALRSIMTALVAAEPAVRLDYLSVADALDLTELTTARPPLVFSGAITVGDIRLIDNLVLGVNLLPPRRPPPTPALP